MIEERLPGFKAYDIRAKVPSELNADIVYDIGRAYVAEIKPDGAVLIGRDVRESGPMLSEALSRGINDAGVDTVDIGQCGTEMVYFGSSLDGMGGGIMVTASHNPKEYNGLKLVRKEGRPISEDTGLMDIERRVRTGDIPKPASKKGIKTGRDITAEYVNKILSFVDTSALKPLRIVTNAGNGCAGPFFDRIAAHLPFVVERMNFTPDGTFPSGVPNPLLPENRSATADAVKRFKADLGVAWDGDFDRCFLFDEKGEFIEGYYIVGVLAKRILATNPGGKIVHDPRLVWNTIDLVTEAGGEPVLSKSGHSFMKEKMRETKAVYGGEMSAHHYFRDFSYSDSGMIPWLLIAMEMSTTGKKLSQIVESRVRRYPCSGEINRKVPDPDAVLETLERRYRAKSTSYSDLDGVTMEFGDTWRFNLRKSNTEPVVRLNVETSQDEDLLRVKTKELLQLIDRTSEP